jgi:hypothetical protein
MVLPGNAVAADSVVAIVNAENPATEITIHELRLMYALYRRTWEGGARVVLVLPVEGTEAIRFLAESVFRRNNPADVGRYYVQAVFQQRIVRAPPSLPLNSAIALVSNEEGAIALVETARAARAVANARVRVLPISE